MNAGGDGLLHRTAWAGAGDAVLFYDPENTGEITGRRQYVFTEWDPTATSDMEALRAVFDSNGDGVLDSSDAAFADFKLLVTNADGSPNWLKARSARLIGLRHMKDKLETTSERARGLHEKRALYSIGGYYA